MGINPSDFRKMQERVAPSCCKVEPKESELHAQIIDFCKSKGWICLHGAMHKRAWRNLGEPDFQIYADKGRCFLVEAKTKSGKLRPEQVGMAIWAVKLGHKIHCVRNFDSFLAIIEDNAKLK
jgi:hypothetical protein